MADPKPESMEFTYEEACAVARSISVHDLSLYRLGLDEYWLDRLKKHSTEELRAILPQWEERLRVLRRVNPDLHPGEVRRDMPEAEYLLVQAQTAVQQLRTLLALRGELAARAKKPTSITRHPKPKKKKKGKRKLAQQTGNEAPESRSEVAAMLKAKVMSIHDWASRAGVDFHTADNYLKGKTRPYPSTRKKLAEALGLPDLPM